MAGADTSDEDDTVATSKEAYDRASDAWNRTYNSALEAIRFVSLNEHWPERIRKQRELDQRPCLTIPLLPPIIRQVVNDGRQNKPAITVHPADDVADPKTAELMNGLIRQIERASHADVAYDTALDFAVRGGFGWLKINTRYANDDDFNQDIVIEAVPNCFSVIPDPDDTGADSAEWNQAFEAESLTTEALERRYEGADPVSFGALGDAQKPAGGRELVQIVHHWIREPSKRAIVALSPPGAEAVQTNPDAALRAAGLLPDNMIVELSIYEANKALFDALGVKIVGRPRDVASHKVRRLTLSGAAVLETLDWAGKYIPIVPVYGNDINIEGERYLSGLVRDAMDEQRRYNFHMTSATEATALAPKTPFIGKVGQFDTDRAKWETANTQTWPFIEFDDVQGALGPPQRQGYSGVPIGDFQMASSASDSVKAITGIHNASLGIQGNETSGRAIMARQREGDVGSFHYTDNLNRAIRHAGQIILDLIPRVYSTPRILRIIGPKDEVERVAVNQPTTIQEKGDDGVLRDIQHVYDLTAGKYDLTVKPGPSFTTRREEAATQMIELIRAYPAVAPVIGDLLAKNLDWPGADEIAERLKAMLPPQLQGENPEAVAAKAQMDQMAKIIGELRGKLAAAESDKSIEARRVEIDAYEAETGRLKAIAPKGTAYDANEMALLVSTSLSHLVQSPDILQAAAAGAPPQAIAQMLAERMGQQQPPADDGSGGAPPAMAA